MASIFNWEKFFVQGFYNWWEFPEPAAWGQFDTEYAACTRQWRNWYNITSSTVGSQETETDELPGELEISCGPEQGNATGTNLLVEESYLEPTNLNNEEG